MNTYELAKIYSLRFPDGEFADMYGLAKLVAEEFGGPIRPCKWMRLTTARRLSALGLVKLESALPDLEIVPGRYKVVERMGFKVQGFEYSVSPAWNKPGKWFIWATPEAISIAMDD